MKKFLLALLALTLLFCFSSCKKDEKFSNTDTSKPILENNTIKTKNKFQFKEKWDVEIPLKDIKEISSRYSVFITNEGFLYQYSDELYKDTDKHYKQLNRDIKFKSLGGCSPITMDNKYWGDYRIPISQYKFTLIENELLSFENFAWSNIRDNEECSLKIANQGNKLFLLDSQNNIYQLLHEFESEEKIIGIYNNGVIKTDKNYYFADVTNKDELKKYADATEVYGLITDELLTMEYNNIQYFDGETAIFKDDKDFIYKNYKR